MRVCVKRLASTDGLQGKEPPPPRFVEVWLVSLPRTSQPFSGQPSLLKQTHTHTTKRTRASQQRLKAETHTRARTNTHICGAKLQISLVTSSSPSAYLNSQKVSRGITNYWRME